MIVGKPVDESIGGGQIAEAENAATKAAAFERLAAAHLDKSYRLARLILGSGADAEDAVHDAFVIAWQKWPSLREPAKFEQWFGRIVVNTCRDRLRQASRRRTQDDADGVVAPDAIDATEDRIALRRALAQLRPDDQIVLALRYHRDLKVDDIAHLLGVRPGTVMSRLHRATGRLRAILSDTHLDVGSR